MPIPGVTIRHTIGDIDGLWLLQIGEPVGVGFLRAVVETYVVTSGERTPQPEPDGRAENRAVVTEGVVFSVFAVGIRPRRQGGDEIGVDGPPDGCGSQSVGHGRYYDGLQARGQEIVHHGFGAAAPKGFDDFDAVRSELLFPVFANVVQEDVAEDEVRYTLCFEMRDGLRHSCLIILHIAFGREINRMEGNADACGLCL